MKRAAAALIVFILLTMSGGTQEKTVPSIDVLLVEANPVLITTDTAEGQASVEGKSIRFLGTFANSPITLNPASPIQFLKVNGKPYRGSLILSIHNGRIRVVNRLTLEEYLYGVVGREMPGSSPEALRAQAIASRTLAYNIFVKGELMHSTVTNQVYGGVDAERLYANQGVDDTRGVILMYGGKPVSSPLFSSACGGVTETSQDVFGKAIPYLVSIKDSDSDPEHAFCSHSNYFQWEYTYGKTELEEILALKGVHGELQDLRAADLDPQGRVKTLIVKTSQGDWTFRNFAIRNALKRPDGKILPSTWFTIEKQDNAYIIKGRGQGHGVGMCQWGAIGMADQGKDYKTILSHYYPGADLQSIY